MAPPTEEEKIFLDALSVLTEPQKALLISLYRDLGQKHLFDEDFFNDAAPPSQRRQFAAQLLSLDQEYTNGGLEGYIAKARKLLADSQQGVNPLEGWTPSVPKGQLFDLGTSQYKEKEAEGIKHLGSCGFVLVAGGLGERLGYTGIKIGLPTEVTTNTTYLEYYISYILAVQEKYAPEGRKLPLCIMTSGDTHKRTMELLQAKNYYGMTPDQVTVVQQGEGVPALLDNDAKFATRSLDRWYEIVTKPHGHGDIHQLLYAHCVAKKWSQLGIEWLVLFQDTNGLAFHTLPVMLGVSAGMDLIMNSLTIPRKAKQAVGGIALLTNAKTGEKRTINVEYNQLDPLLRSSGQPDGDVNDPKTGFSPYPGNINQLLFKVKPYVEVLERTKGLMPEFVNPKYKDDTKTVFKSPTRLECMMQDFPTVLEAKDSARVGFTSIAAELCFSPVKNATEDGVKLQASGTAPGTAASGEADQYAAFRIIMDSIGCNIDVAKKEVYAGISVQPGPAIVLHPSFVATPSEYEVKFPFPTSVHISARSTLVVRGSGVVIESLNLDGTLIIDYRDGRKVTIKDKKVVNGGWVRIKDESSNADEVTKMRGYRIVQQGHELMPPDAPGCSIM